MTVIELKDLQASLDSQLNAKFEEISALLMKKHSVEHDSLGVDIKLVVNGQRCTIYSICIDNQYGELGDMQTEDHPDGVISFYELSSQEKIVALEQLELL